MKLVLEIDDKGSIKKVELLDKKFTRFENSVKRGSTKISSGMKRIQRSVQGLTGPFKRMALMAKMAFAAMAVASIVVGAQFEQSMANVASVAGATGAELHALSNTARAWGSSTAYSANEAAVGMYSLASAGQSVADIQKSIGPILLYAGATATELGAACEYTVQALKMFNLEASDTGRVTNVMAAGISASMLNSERLGNALSYVGKTAHAFGLTIEETVSALGLLHNAGLMASVAGTSLKNVLSRLGDPNKELQAILGDVSLETHKFADIMEHLREKGMSATEAYKAFGRFGANAVLTFVQVGKKGMEELEAKITGTQKAMEMYQAQMDTVKSRFKIFKSAITENMIAVFMELKPIITEALDYLIAMVIKIKPYVVGAVIALAKFIDTNRGLIKGLALGTVVAGILGTAFIAIGSTFAAIKLAVIGFSGAIMVLSGVFSILKVAWLGTMAAIKTAFFVLKYHWIVGWSAMHAASIGPIGWIVIAAIAAIGLIILAFTKFRKQTMSVLKPVGGFFKTLFEAVGKGAHWLAGKIKDVFKKPFDWVKDKLEWLAEKAGWLMEKIVPGWKDKWAAMGDIVEEKAVNIGENIKKNLGTAFEAVGNFAGSSKDKTISIFEGLKGKVRELIDRIKSMAKDGIGFEIDLVGLEQARQEIEKLRNDSKAASKTIEDLADAEKAKWIRTIGTQSEASREWYDAKVNMIYEEMHAKVNATKATQSQIAKAEIEGMNAIRDARATHEQAIIEQWMANNEIIMMGLGMLEAAYDTFFGSLFDKEMTMKMRREAMWESMKKSFLRTTASMLKSWLKMHLKNLFLKESAEKASHLKTKYLAAKEGAVKAYSAFAAIPIIGPMLGAIAAAAAFAFLMAFHKGGLVGGFEPRERIVRVETGEYVMKRDSVSAIGTPALNYMNLTGKIPTSRPENNINLTFNVSGGGVDVDMLQELIEDEIVPRLEMCIGRGQFSVEVA